MFKLLSNKFKKIQKNLIVNKKIGQKSVKIDKVISFLNFEKILNKSVTFELLSTKFKKFIKF